MATSLQAKPTSNVKLRISERTTTSCFWAYERHLVHQQPGKAAYQQNLRGRNFVVCLLGHLAVSTTQAIFRPWLVCNFPKMFVGARLLGRQALMGTRFGALALFRKVATVQN